MKKIITAVFLFAAASIYGQAAKVMTGADLLISENMELIKGKTLGIVTNHTGVLSNGVHLVDTLNKIPGIKIAALFGPEHGIRGDAPDGISLEHGADAKTGIKVYSLYGAVSKPDAEMLKGIDVLVYDIQDVGARFYTFISTMYYILEAGAENNIPVIVLDRPNPINGLQVEGPIRDSSLSSFVGIAPIPITYGLTAGELAECFNNEELAKKGLKANLTVVKMKNWKREMFYDETGLAWIKPSPNIPFVETAMIYPGTCLIEGTNVSEGRGTMNPFLTIGAPYINSGELIAELNKADNKGVKLDTISFMPKEIPNMAKTPKYDNKICRGIKITVTDKTALRPVEFGIKLLCSLQKLYPQDFTIREKGLERLLGDKNGFEKITSGETAQNIIASWDKDLDIFKSVREKYIIY
ncbi:MAG TPA: DUF1343 domain-containing protein [Ignavibacteriales bacterium]|nr:DUF1343 domain-containing protein [Ignavibacteriales bacterium]